jgi:NAD(P)-dependent dehydrogenase (short-subunit alcohol dehydrogenase family)
MKYALVTGGSRGIGRSISLKLSAMGYPVIVNYRSNQEAAEETKRLIEEAGGVCELLPFNVSDVEAVDKAMEQWSEKHPEDYIAVLVNNAGIREDTLMVFMQNDQWGNVLDTNLNGFFYITQQASQGHAHQEIWTYHQCRFSLWLEGPSRPGELFCRQGRHHRSHQGIGAGGRAEEGDGKCSSTRLYHNGYDQGTQ